MNWLIWRQHRKLLFIFTGLVLIFAAVAIPSGLHFWHEYTRISAICGQNCNVADLKSEIFKTQLDGLTVNFVKLAVLGLPLLLGLFVGVPLLAKEYAEKTNRLVWTQGISRKKWLTYKVIWVLLATIVCAGILSAVATWFSKTGNVLYQDRFAILAFSSQGIAPVAAAAFAVSVGIMFGAWFKKVLPALGVTLGFLLVLQIAVPLVARAHYVTPSVYNTASVLNENGVDDPFQHSVPKDRGAWIISEKLISKTGQELDWSAPPISCKIDHLPTPKQEESAGKRHGVIGRNDTFLDVDCINSLGYHWELKYQPSYRYWNFQRIEVGLYATLSLAAIGATYLFVLKRDA